jgi:hypothetical protein
MDPTSEMSALVTALKQVRSTYPSTQAMADASGLEYAALWRILDGRGQRAVSMEFLILAMAVWREVREAVAQQVAAKEQPMS